MAPSTTLLERVLRVFALRRTHAVPGTVEAPPASWEVPFQVMAEEIGLLTLDFRQAHFVVATHWDQTRAAGSSSDHG